MSIVRTASLVVLVLALLASAAPQAVAQEATPQPPPPATHRLQAQPTGPIQNPDGLWMMPAGAEGAAEGTQLAPQATGGPDDFGYTWDDSVPLNWIDASGGIETGINANVDHVGPINIGFPFKYYENTRSQLYISRYGFLAFNDNTISNSQSEIPSAEKPDDVIAPHWVPGYSLNGYVRYLRGGSAPNRWFVVEWNRLVSDCCNDQPEEYTFEAILHENGDIVFQYGAMVVGGSWYCQASGIEDSTGLDGLGITQYCRQIPGNHATRVRRPSPAARVHVSPLHQGAFVHDGEQAAFDITIRNTGERGADTYDLLLSSPWGMAVFKADGVTPLTDTDGDGERDTGLVPQGGARTIVAKVTTPPNATVGNHNTANLTVRSSIDTGKQKQADLRSAVPSTFAQAFEEWGSSMSLMLARPEARVTVEATEEGYYGANVAVAEQPSGNLVYTWTRGRCLNNCTVQVDEIEYAILDPYGDLVRSPIRLLDLSGATVDTRDNPTIAVAPNGRIGLIWSRYLWNRATGQYNYNVYFAVLSAAGDLIHGPTNLTNNNAWGNYSDLNVPQMFYPRIAATGDSRFVLAWYRGHRESQGYVEDVWYSVRQSNGVSVKAPTNLTHDGPDYSDGYGHPALAATAGNRALLAFRRYGSYDDLYFVVLDHDGNVVRSMNNLTGDGYNSYEYFPDAIELSDGRIMVAWSGQSWTGTDWRLQTRFAVLDSAFNRVAGPTTLPNPAAVSGDWFVSVAADNAGRAVITWMDYDYYSRRNLYYALVRSNGNIQTPATTFRSSQAAQTYLFTSFEGYGNTSYSWTPPAGVDNRLTLEQSIYSGVANGDAVIDIHYSGRGGQKATGAMLTATLDPRLAYRSDTSGVTPTVSGNTVTWNLPDVRLYDRREFLLQLRVTSGALGDLMPVQLELTSTQPDLNPDDNAVSVAVRVDRPLYLPLAIRR